MHTQLNLDFFLDNLARPSAMRACLRTSWMAVLISMGPEAGAADGTSSPSTSDMVSSSMWVLSEIETSDHSKKIQGR